MRNRKGFTLIELLVVIAIIALLLAVIVPSLRKAKEAAWNVICRNNLKNYGIAGLAYVDNNNRLFPNAWGSIFKSIDPDRGCQWHDQARNPIRRPDLAGSLWPYLGDQDKSHLCPVFDRFARQIEPDRPGHAAAIPVEPIFGYSMNGFLGGFEYSGGVYNHTFRVKHTEIRSPSTIFFFGEENPWIVSGRYGNTLNDNALCGSSSHPSTDGAWTVSPTTIITRSATGSAYVDCLASFHKTTFEKKDEGESNVVFVDGHVDMADWENTFRMSRWANSKPVMR